MQVTETLNEGLKRELKIIVPAQELEDRLATRLNELKDEVRLKGFRPGKVPVAHLRKIYGRSVLAEIIEQTVSDTSQKAINERGEKPALQPAIRFSEDKEEVEAVLSGKADLSYGVTFEVVPEITPMEFKELKLEKLVAEVSDDEVNEAIERLADEQKSFADREEDAKTQMGDQVVIDFTGRVDGEKFDGGSAEDAPLVVGSNSYIPGFEEQLVGTKVGDELDIKVTFPDDYGVAALAGKAAVFEVEVKELTEPVAVPIDDAFAERLGATDLNGLRDAVKGQISEQYDQMSKARLKRVLLDVLDDGHAFELPEKLVEQEFEQVWHQVTDDMEKAGRSFEDDNTTEQSARDEFGKIAERRVRLGLLMRHIGDGARITVSDDEVNRALMEQVRQYPGQEKEVYELYQKNPEAMASLRAPVFEQKVVDYVLELASVSDRTVSREALYADPDQETDDAKPAAKKKSGAKTKPKTAAKTKPKSGGKTKAGSKATKAGKT